MSQTDEVLALLRGYYRAIGLTSYQAFQEIGTMRLAARIRDLRDSGIAIDTDTIEVHARNGRKVRVSRYRLAA